MSTVLCMGDSLTLGSDLPHASRWPERLGGTLGVEVINAGVDGDTTGGILARFPGALDRHRPDAVLLQGGTNDLWWGVDTATIQANLFAMVCQARHRNVAPVVATPPPLCLDRLLGSDTAPPHGGFEGCQEAIRLLARLLAAAARWSEVPLLDFYHLFVDGAHVVDTDRFLPDGLHPNGEGHRRMAEIAAALLRKEKTCRKP